MAAGKPYTAPMGILEGTGVETALLVSVFFHYVDERRGLLLGLTAGS